MARISYLVRRGASYYCRLRVPLDLVDIMGKRELVKALGTKDEHEAKQRMWPVVQSWNREFVDLRSRRELTEDDKSDATWSHYSDTLDRDEVARQSMPTQETIDEASRQLFAKAKAGELFPADRGEVDPHDPLAILDATLEVRAMQEASRLDAVSRRVKLDHLRRHLRPENNVTALVDHEIAAYADKHGLLVDPKSPQYLDLARRMMRAEIEALQRTLERDTGDYSGTPRDPIVKPATGTSRQRAKPGETIMELFEVYARENPRQISQDTLNQARRDINTFLDLVGASYPVQRIDKKAVREWKALLMRYPVKASETKAFAGMNIAQIVRVNEQIGKPVLTPRTVNRYLASLGAFSAWLVSHGYLDANPTAGMSLAKSKEVATRPFTPQQLDTLFRSPLFVGCQSADEWRKIALPGSVLIRDHRYWLPLIMLFSGARPAEIAQLNVADVRLQHGHPIMHVTIEGDGGKSVKTAGSMRVVPVHPELVRLGFLDYHSSMMATGETRLFPLAKRNSRGQMIADFSREFGRYLTRIGIKDGRGVSLYSFRHGAADALRRAGHLDEEFGFILGHTASTMTGRYGQLPQGMLEQRVALIRSIAYPDLDLGHLTTV
jgi:integrase